MAQKPEKFRLRLNLFDSIVIILALAVGALLLWNALKPDTAPEQVETSTVRYTLCFQRWIEGTSSVIKEGARLTDSVRNYELGNVVSTQAIPATEQLTDVTTKSYVQAVLEGYEDVLVTVEAPCVKTEESITLGGGYALRVGATAFIQGDGFLASGFVYAIERED